MKKEIIGIVAEFNPLHDGHKYLINTIKQKKPDSIIVVAMSGQFVQRGEISIIDKWERAKSAIENNVDLIIEIPPFYVLNNANIFARKSIEILSDFNASDIYFGTESLDIKEINFIVSKIINEKKELEKLKKEMHSLPKAFEKFIGKKIKPNDILAISYLLASREMKKNINFHRIKRNVKEFKSASIIRKEIFQSQTNSHLKRNIDDFSDIIIGKLITTNVNEGSLKYLKKQFMIHKNKTLSELICKSSNSSFTESRLRRDLMRFILDLKDEDKRIILGFNSKGKTVLKNSSNYDFRHTKNNNNNLKIESFISLKGFDIKEQLSKSSIIKK